MPSAKSAPPEQPHESAAAAGLRYILDDRPGITRVKRSKSFQYLEPDGKPVRDSEHLGRIKSLAIPPAWERVWICPVANGHLQAVGYDVKGRKQYRYHRRWREVRDDTKYNKMMEFGRALPKIRKTVSTHLALPGLPREKVLAAVVRLLEISLIRVGNDEYAKNNSSYGLTTMLDRSARGYCWETYPFPF
jgi:DNA topoisomerase I